MATRLIQIPGSNDFVNPDLVVAVVVNPKTDQTNVILMLGDANVSFTSEDDTDTVTAAINRARNKNNDDDDDD